MKKTALIFDLDGTLWDCGESVAKIWNETFRQFGLPCTATVDIIHGYMGKTVEQIAKEALPDMPEAERLEIFRTCCENENGYLARVGGTLYPDLAQTLEKLKERGYLLAVVSNCQDGYLQAFLTSSGLENVFDDFEMAGRTGLSKAENILLVADRMGAQRTVYIGDTVIDEEAARQAGAAFVHAAYGFGRAESPDAVLGQIAELPDKVEILLGTNLCEKVTDPSEKAQSGSKTVSVPGRIILKNKTGLPVRIPLIDESIER